MIVVCSKLDKIFLKWYENQNYTNNLMHFKVINEIGNAYCKITKKTLK